MSPKTAIDFTGSREKAIDKARKLLALGASDNEHEAASATTKAQAVMFAYNLTLEDLVSGEATPVGEYRTDFNILVTWQTRLVQSVAATSLCGMYVSQTRRKIGGKFTAKVDSRAVLVGRTHDTELAELLLGWLMGELNRLSNEYADALKQSPELMYRTPAARKVARRSWLEGAAQTVAMRLRASFDERRQADEASMALVVHSTADIEAFLAKKDLVHGKSKKDTRKNDWASYSKGRLDGEQVALRPEASE